MIDLHKIPLLSVSNLSNYLKGVYIKTFLIEHCVTVTINEEIISTDPVPTMKSTATISDGENAIHATALVGVDLNQKGMQTAQQFGAASTYGKKYALGNLLLIDDTEDADAQKPSKAVDKIKQAAKPAITAEQLKKAKAVTKDDINKVIEGGVKGSKFEEFMVDIIIRDIFHANKNNG